MKYVLIDADTGIDDSLAILYALKNPKMRVVGITTCFGNNNAQQSADNSARLVKLSHCGYEVPVVCGANESIDGVFSSAPACIHGDNGIGNVELPPSDVPLCDEDCTDFILRMSHEYDGQLIIITTGRLVNLAKAVMKDPSLPRRVRKVVSMGGNWHVPGNLSPYAEANIMGDPHAADVVFGAGFRLTLVGLDVTMKTILTGHDLKAALDNAAEDSADALAYIKEALKFYFEFHRVSLGMADCSVMHDPLAVLIAEDPSLGIYEMQRIKVEYKDPEYMGMLKGDLGFIPDDERDEIAICVKVDSDKAVRRFWSVFQNREFGRYNQK